MKSQEKSIDLIVRANKQLEDFCNELAQIDNDVLDLSEIKTNSANSSFLMTLCSVKHNECPEGSEQAEWYKDHYESAKAVWYFLEGIRMNNSIISIQINLGYFSFN